MKKALLISLFLLIFSSQPSFAESEYVLPYPASMPGNKFYLLQELKNNVLQYWYFGNFAQFTYNLNQSDKFLVEAKTLFEYKQYLLADKALKRSDYFFSKAPTFLENAKKENKNISEKKQILHDAALKHVEFLTSVKNSLPENFIWNPEKSASTTLTLKKDIDTAIAIRTKAL